MLDPAATKLGGVETHNDARTCAELFRQHRDRISGVLVCLPNFGDEKGVADTDTSFYMPTLTEAAVCFGGLGWFAMLFLLFIKIFPCVSVAETLQGEPAAAHPELEEDAAATSATEVQHA